MQGKKFKYLSSPPPPLPTCINCEPSLVIIEIQKSEGSMSIPNSYLEKQFVGFPYLRIENTIIKLFNDHTHHEWLAWWCVHEKHPIC